MSGSPCGCMRPSCDSVKSLKVMVAAVVLAIAITSAAVAVVPLYVVATESVDQLADQYITTVAREVNQSVSVYFRASQNVVSSMTAGSRLSGYSHDSEGSIFRWLQYGTTLAGADLVAMIFDLPYPLYTGSLVSPAYESAPAGTFYATRYNTTHGDVFLVNSSNVQDAVLHIVLNRTAPFRTRQYYPLIRARQAWGHSFVGTVLGIREAVLPCGAPIVLPNGTSVGAFYLRTRQAVIVTYFRKLRVASTGRAMLIDPETGALIASNGDADPTLTLVNGTRTVTTFRDVQDPLLRSGVLAFDKETLTTCATPCRLQFEYRGDPTYVAVSSVDDEFQLNKRLVVMIPSNDFLGGIRDGVRVSLWSTAGAIAGLMVLGVLAVVVLASPLGVLRRRLEHTTTLDGLDEDTAPASFITEIREIEHAFDRLRAELKKMRSFLPQGVLELVGESSTSDDEFVCVVGAGPLDRECVSEDCASKTISAATDTADPFPTKRRMRGAIQTSLNLECVLVSRRVSVVVTNIRGFHQLLEQVGPVEFHRRHAEVLAAALGIAKQHNGVINNVSGDHFFLGWNTSTHRRMHVSCAARFVLQMHAFCRTAAALGPAAPVPSSSAAAGPLSMAAQYAVDREAPRMVFGLATGTALCGNFGCEGLKQPSVIGPVVQQAFALMHQCAPERAVSLCNGEAAAVLKDEVALVHWNYVMLPQSTAPCTISLMLGLLLQDADAPPGSDVSSHRLTAGEDRTRRVVNAAFDAFTAGRFQSHDSLAVRGDASLWLAEGLRKVLALVKNDSGAA